MAQPHPGKWKPLFVIPEGENQPDTVLNTEHTAANACLICVDLETQKTTYKK